MVHFDRIEFTVHAQRRMEERSISEAMVVGVLSAPDQTYLDGNEYVAESLGEGNKPLRVVYTQHDEFFGRTVRIVSVYRIRKLKTL